MKTKYNYIHFKEVDDYWECRNNKKNKVLGIVYTSKQWKQYVYAPQTITVYSADCLADIQHFMKQLKEAVVCCSGGVKTYATKRSNNNDDD